MVRRFDISIDCATCVKKIDKAFSKYPDLKYSFNIIEKILVVESSVEKYPSTFIINLIEKLGYSCEEI